MAHRLNKHWTSIAVITVVILGLLIIGIGTMVTEKQTAVGEAMKIKIDSKAASKIAQKAAQSRAVTQAQIISPGVAQAVQAVTSRCPNIQVLPRIDFTSNDHREFYIGSVTPYTKPSPVPAEEGNTPYNRYITTIWRREVCRSAGCTFSGLDITGWDVNNDGVLEYLDVNQNSIPDYSLGDHPLANDACSGNGTQCPKINQGLPLFNTAGGTYELGRQQACESANCIFVNGGDETPTGDQCFRYSCVGGAPPNSELCVGDDLGLPSNLTKVFTSACTAAAKCEYVCSPGFFKSGDSCARYSCLGALKDGHSPLAEVAGGQSTFAAHYESNLCSGDDQGLATDTLTSTVSSCTDAQKCERTCDEETEFQNGKCVLTLKGCTGSIPANAIFCSYNFPSSYGTKPITLKSDCHYFGQCSFTCFGTALVGSQCVAEGLPECTDIPSYAQLCPGSDQELSGPTESRLVASCHEEIKCSYTCNPGYVIGGGGTYLGSRYCKNVVHNCTGMIPENAYLCPKNTYPTGDRDGDLSADTPRTLGDGCGSQKCRYVCNEGYRKEGDKCVEVCTGIKDPHANPCFGDQAGFTGYLPKKLVDACTDNEKCEYTCWSSYFKSGNACVHPPEPPRCNSVLYGQLCPDDDKDLTKDVIGKAVSSCSQPAGSEPKCEYTCKQWYTKEGDYCVSLFKCLGTMPLHAALCQDDDSDLTQGITVKAVDACTSRKCEAQCLPDYTASASGDACLSAS